MPQLTPNLSLQTFDLTTDAGVYFSTFRVSLAGYTNSSLTKIDTWAGQVNTDISLLKQSPAIKRVLANKDTDTAYNATVLNFSQYSVDTVIALSLDVSNVGTLVLNINSLGAKSLLKADPSGSLVNIEAGDLRAGAINLFIYNGVAWVWVTALSGKQININGTAGNILAVGADKNIVDSGVSYATTATADKIVQRTSTGQIKTPTAVANDDAINKLYGDTIDNKIGVLASLTTTNKTSVVNAINEVDSDLTSIDTKVGDLSSLTTTNKTSAVGAINELDSDIIAVDDKIGLLSALQTIDKTDVVSAINENSSAIGQIATDRGYLNAVIVLDCNLAIQNGKYVTSNGVNTPSIGTFTLDVSAENTESISQLAICTYGSVVGRSFFRYRLGSVWSAWREIATTESAIGTLLNGWTGGAVITKSGNIVTVELDLSNGVVSSATVLINIPMVFRPQTVRYLSITGTGGGNYIIQVNPNGDLTINNGATTWTTAQKVGSICFSII